MKFLLDTDTCIHVFRGRPSVISRVEAVAGDDLAISAISYYELIYGVKLCAVARQETELRKVEALIQHIHLLPFDSLAARRAAEIRRELEEAGRGIGPMDILIAATALVAGLVLVTGNVREFGRIKGLKVESWGR